MITLWELFISFFKVGSFSFGGGIALLPIIEKEIVANNSWLSPDEFLKVTGMVKIFPGAISIKYATYTGYKVAGVPGAIVANLGNMIIPATIIILAYYFYSKYEENEYVAKAFKGIQFIVLGLIASVLVEYTMKLPIEWKSVVFVAIGFLLTFVFKLHPAVAVGVGAAVAMILY
jgi:chromate transporter